MKNIKFILVWVVCISSQFVFGAELFKPSTDTYVSDNAKRIINSRIAVVNYQKVEIDLAKTKDQQVSVHFFNEKTVLSKDRIEFRKKNSYSYFAQNEDQNFLILSVREGDVTGILTTKSKIYRIETIGNAFFIMEIDQGKYPDENCGLNHEQNPNNDFNEEAPKYYEREDAEAQKQAQQQQQIDFDCKLRVLVLYTPAAKNAVSNINNTIQLAMDEFNQSLINSDVNFQAELIYVDETNHQEQSIEDDTEDFALDNDGVIDEVHDLREEYSADISVLIGEGYNFCGRVAGIKTCSDVPFCVVNVECATGNFSFAHEIGHLMGARHNEQADPATSPYSYGHGFRNDNDSWRTIMSLSNGCPGSCPRLQFWSNPDITFGGVSMGTSTTNDNARVLNENIDNTMTFRPDNGSRSVVQQDVNPTEGLMFNEGDIDTDGSVIIHQNDEWAFYAGNSIELKPGFEAQNGSYFEAEILSACGTPDYQPCNQFPAFKNTEEFDSKPYTNINIEIYPIPTDEQITINIAMKESDMVLIELYDYSGKYIEQIQSKKCEAGINQINYSLSSIRSGVYFIKATIGETQTTTTKIIKL